MWCVLCSCALNQTVSHLTGSVTERSVVCFVVVTRGSFRLRGDTLAIFPVYEDIIWRLEFFGDTLERISSIDDVTGELV